MPKAVKALVQSFQRSRFRWSQVQEAQSCNPVRLPGRTHGISTPGPRPGMTFLRQRFLLPSLHSARSGCYGETFTHMPGPYACLWMDGGHCPGPLMPVSSGLTLLWSMGPHCNSRSQAAGPSSTEGSQGSGANSGVDSDSSSGGLSGL